jgi:hypothetical protein
MEIIPFRDRPTCTIDQAVQASGIGRTKLFELISDQQLETLLIGRRRLVKVPSLLKLLQSEAA